MDGDTDCKLTIETSDISDREYLDALTVLFEEWSSDTDAEAYDSL